MTSGDDRDLELGLTICNEGDLELGLTSCDKGDLELGGTSGDKKTWSWAKPAVTKETANWIGLGETVILDTDIIQIIIPFRRVWAQITLSGRSMGMAPLHALELH